MKFIFCSISKHNSIADTCIAKSEIFKSDPNLLYIETSNAGKKGLSQFYNECIEKFKDKDAIIFCHDDVTIISNDILFQIEKGFTQYDVIGAAGCINPKIIEKNLWHWMAGDKTNWRGFVGHPYDPNVKDSFIVTSFGHVPSRVAIIDGVFMAINIKKIIQSKTRFDEQFKFHHYDIDFSLTCNKNKITIGVWPVVINHQSPGLHNFNQEWNESNNKFINKWKNK